MQTKLLSALSCLMAAVTLAGCGAAAAQPEATPAPESAVTAPVEDPAPAETAEPAADEAPADTLTWRVEPQYAFDELVPLYSRGDRTAGYGTAEGFYAVRQGERWSLFTAEHGLLLADRMVDQPYLYSPEYLSGWFADDPSETNYDLMDAFCDGINGELRESGAAFEYLVGGIGGFGSQWIYTDTGIYRSYLGNYEFEGTPLAEVTDAPALFGVQQAAWDDAYYGYVVDDGAMYAIADRDGNLLSGFEYRDVAMYGQDLIAVEDAAGSWGYCDSTGAVVIPCQYPALLRCGGSYEAVAMPYPEMSGLVVVADAEGRKLALAADGTVVIDAGQFEDLAPAQDGCIWAKQNGLWGLLEV